MTSDDYNSKLELHFSVEEGEREQTWNLNPPENRSSAFTYKKYTCAKFMRICLPPH